MEREQRIREIAYRLWVEEGYPVGQKERHLGCSTFEPAIAGLVAGVIERTASAVAAPEFERRRALNG